MRLPLLVAIVALPFVIPALRADPNAAPVISAVDVAASAVITTCDQATFTVAASDRDHEPIRYRFAVAESPPGSDPALEFRGRQAMFNGDVPGTYEIEITVQDARGAEVERRLRLQVGECALLAGDV